MTSRLPGAPEDRILDMDALHRLQRLFLARYPDFAASGFQATTGGYWQEERSHKQEIITQAQALMAQRDMPVTALGQAMLSLLRHVDFIGWRVFTEIQSGGAEAEQLIATALGEMLRDPADPATVAATAAAKIHPLIA
jgi:hypothetical protein